LTVASHLFLLMSLQTFPLPLLALDLIHTLVLYQAVAASGAGVTIPPLKLSVSEQVVEPNLE
jgi:hypothetical protein